MNSDTDFYPSIHISSLEAARECDLSIYDGVITIEDTTIEIPLRIDDSICPQLVLRFDDISTPMDNWVEPSEKHIAQALHFADNIGSGSLLVHCHWGISRSSGIALAIIAKGLGMGKEIDAVKELEKINPYCSPNALIVWLTDEILERNGNLYKATSSRVTLTGSAKPSSFF